MQHEDNDSASWERATVVEVGKKITVQELKTHRSWSVSALHTLGAQAELNPTVI